MVAGRFPVSLGMKVSRDLESLMVADVSLFSKVQALEPILGHCMILMTVKRRDQSDR